MRRTVIRHRVSPVAHAVLTLIIGVVVTACSASLVQASADQVAQQPSTVEAPADGCPAITPKEPDATTAVAVDYVDFVVVGRTMYIAGLSPAPAVKQTELGEIVMTSQCSYRELNDRTRRETPTPGNGDTAFLPPGTPVYALRGWSPSCRLAAAHNGELHVYLAQQDGGTHARPTVCAVG